MASKPLIGWIGTGMMGAPMCHRILDAGYELTVFSRSGRTLDGADRAESVGELAASSDVVVTIVSHPSDVERLYLGDEGLLHAARERTTLIDMTTSSPDLARRLHEQGERRGLSVLDAPVSGGPPGAEGGTLSVMVGGDANTLETARPLLEVLGSQIIHHGDAGSGQSAKAVNQVLVAATMLGLAEGFGLAERVGLDPDKVLETVRNGVAGSPLLDFMWSKLRNGDMDPGFRVEHLMKDLRIATDEGAAVGAPLPGAAMIRELYAIVAAAGGGQDGTQAIIRALYRAS